MVAILVNREVLDFVNADAARQHALKTHRPTAVAIVENERGRILFVKSTRGSWGFPQGGVEASEEVVAALLRELYEEVGIESANVEVRAHCLTDRLDTSHRRDGFLNGKQYYYFHVGYRGPAAVVISPEEVSDFCWLPRRLSTLFIESLDDRYRKKKLGMLAALSRMSRSPESVSC
jgi:8-oxo-dGTP pyrophosphatase MutT (NUDIX family)